MRRFLLSLTGIASLMLALSQPSLAQDKEKDKSKDKSRSSKEEIIIHRKSDKDARVTIEIRDDEVLVNGKPVDEFEDDDISISKRKGVTIIRPRTPFRSQGGAWSFGDHDVIGLASGEWAFLGVATQKDDKGAFVEEVTDESAAEKAGLKKGDIITKVDDEKIGDPQDLTDAIRERKPDDKVKITYLRDGKEQTTTATLTKRKGASFGDFHMPRVDVNPHFDMKDFHFNWRDGDLGRVFSYGGRPRLGIQAQDTEDGKGVKVIRVDDESAAAKAGLKQDDIITEFDGKTVNSTDELSAAAREAREKASVKVKVDRDGKSQTLEIKTPRKLKTANL